MTADSAALIITFIRHGMTAGNQERRYIGQTDLPLAEQGIKQLEDYKRQGRYPHADALYSSPLKRCRETARILYPMLVPVTLSSLTELDFGTFEGKNYEQLKDDPAYRKWIDSAGMVAPPGGESGEELWLRLENALRQIMLDAERSHFRRPAVITHGGCMMTLLSRLSPPESSGGFYDYQVGNGGGFILKIDARQLSILEMQPL